MHPLKEWQERLSANFEDITSKKLNLSQRPVTFALEHGLTDAERTELNAAIHASVNENSLRHSHYVCWVVYAAELGYLFAGDEYWHTFEEQTPLWDSRDRPFIKDCFSRFARQFNGAIPKGSWAQHFSIICWPITHSILPKDLQRQLAGILFRIRHSVVMDDVESPRQLGRLIAQHSEKATSRFRQMSSDPELIGQIAAALLLDEQQLDLIETRTLSRIVADLNTESQARSWLRDARHHLSRRAQIKGLSKQQRTSELPGRRTVQPPRPPIRPRLFLRDSKDDNWRLFLEVPDLTPMLRNYPNLQPIFSKAQVNVGTYGRPMPARALLHGSQSVAQPEWPNESDPLLDFQPTHRDLDTLLQQECAVNPAPWLFRVGVEGTARENRQKKIVEGGDYIIVGPPGLLNQYAFGQPVAISCGNVVAQRFEASELDELVDLASPLGLDVVRKIVAKPVGIIPADWDSEGSAEWLSTDQPMISLESNYAIDHYDLLLNVGTEDLFLNSQPANPTEAVIVQLPELHAGVYHLSVTAHSKDPRHRPEYGDLEIIIRDPMPADVHRQGRVAMMVIIDPTEATLEDIFEGNLNIQIIGPETREVTATIRLLSRRKVRPLSEEVFQHIHLPMSSDDWTKRINSLLESKIDFVKAYQEANSCELIFDGGDLGVYVSVYDRPYAPLRWGVTHSRDSMSISLYDDADVPQNIEVVRYEFEAPFVKRRVTDMQLKQATQGGAIPGLYVAHSGSYTASTIVPMQSLEILKTAKPRFHRPKRNPETVNIFLDCIDAWGNVNTTGNVFGRFAWRQSRKAMLQQLAGLIGGTAWYKAELAFDRADEPNIQNLANRIPFKQFGSGWEKPLLLAVKEFKLEPIEDRVTRLGNITGETYDLCRFALRMSSDPTNIRKIYKNRFESMLQTIMHKSQIFRAARFFVLATSNRLNASSFGTQTIYVGWQWS